MNTFEFTGTLSMPKESEKFKPLASYDKPHWKGEKIVFQVKNDANNTQLLEIMGGYNKDGSTIIKTMSNEKDENGKMIKKDIAWNNRLKPEVIADVANFRKYVFDAEENIENRWTLQRYVKALEASAHDGDAIKGLQENFGMAANTNALEFAKELLSKSYAKRKEFLSEYDFVEFIKKAIPACGDKVFTVTGTISYELYNGKEMQKFKPQQIRMAAPGIPQRFKGEIEVFFDKTSLDDSMFGDLRKYYINGYVRNYSSVYKKEIGIPVTMTIDGSKFTDENEMATRQLNFLKNLFNCESDTAYYVVGVKTVFANGNTKIELTEDMLTDFEREQIALQLATLEDFKKVYGKNLNGNKEKETKITSLATAYMKTGKTETAYTLEDFLLPAEEETLDQANNASNSPAESSQNVMDMDDLFS